ncbi:MAG: hypothetical protein KKH72_09660 [Alphaproteobacteria bacterium]|nr:hypothetical protein [Alphaproteobacteria bacterium]
MTNMLAANCQSAAQGAEPAGFELLKLQSSRQADPKTLCAVFLAMSAYFAVCIGFFYPDSLS